MTSKHRPTSPQAKQVPDPKSPKLAGRIKITETKSPELARTRTASSRLGKEAGAKKVASFHEGKRPPFHSFSILSGLFY